jgi:hypothetical protein
VVLTFHWLPWDFVRREMHELIPYRVKGSSVGTLTGIKAPRKRDDRPQRALVG